jgi:hypothetical protein
MTSMSAEQRIRYRPRQTESKKRYYKAHPEVLRAHQVIWKAVYRGRIVKPDACERCDKKCNPHGHHADYSKPLKVIWLCLACHKKEHQRMKLRAAQQKAPGEGL